MFVFAFANRFIAVITIGVVSHKQIDYAHGVCGDSARIERYGIGDFALCRLRMSYIAGELGEKSRHIDIVNRLKNSRTQIVEPAETLVALRAVGKYRMFVAPFGQNGYFVKFIQGFVGTLKRPDYFARTMYVFADDF